MSWSASLLRYVSKRSLLLVIALALAVTPALVGALARAADVTIAVDGSTRYQTMDGFGVSANSEMWKGGQLKPALDMLVDQNGSTLFRVIVDMTDWEATNDNADPFTYDWTYYDQVYSSPKFQDLWATIAYLNSKGITNNIVLDFMGRGPAWLGGATLSSSKEDEWVEMVSSAAYYARNTAHVQFGMFAPDNEPDLGAGIEGIAMSGTVFADAMAKLATRLDTIGLTDLRLLGPDTATPNIYWGEMAAYPALMAKVDHLTFHSYTGATNGADADIKRTAPTKNFWMDEYSVFHDSFALLSQGASALLMWDGYDSAYFHPLLHGATYTPPNDAGNGPALVAYDNTTGVYSPRKEFYQFGQLYKFVPAGSQRVGATASGSGVSTVAFQDPATGRVTVVGENTSSRSLAISVTLTNVPMPGALQYFQTNGSSNLAAGAPVAVSAGTANVTVPSGTIFTLTGLPSDTSDTVAPTVTLTSPADGSTVAGTQTVAASAGDDVAVAGVRLQLDGVDLGPEVTVSPYATSWDTTTASNGSHTLTAVARDAAGHTASSSVTVTVQNAVASAGTLLLGTKTVQGAADSNPSGSAEAFSYTAAATGPAGTLSFYVDSGSSASTVKLGVYSDAGNGPGALLASGSVTAPTSGAWNTVPLTPQATLTAGVRYWVGLLGTGGSLSYRDTAAGSCSQSASGGGLTSLPATWSSGTPWPTCNLSAYVSAAAGPADVTAPTVPDGVAATTTGFTGITVTWQPSTDDVGVAGYHVYRGTKQVATTTDPTYADTGLTPGATYGYTVTAFDAAGNESVASAAAAATTVPDVTGPTAPTGVAQTGATDTTATMSWTRSTDDVAVTGYRYYLGSSTTANGTTTGTSATYTGLGCGLTYGVRVVAYDAAGNQSTDGTGQVTTTACPAQSALALDRQVTTHQTQRSSSITSAGLTTSGRNELLVAFLSSDGPRSVTGQSFSSVSGGGLTWTLRKRVNSRYGTSEIWTAPAANVVTGLTVTGTRSNGSYLGSITVAAFKGANLAAVGAVGGASAMKGAANASIVATRSGSLVWGVGNDWDNATARSVSPGQRLVDQYLGSDGDTFWVQSQNATTVAGQRATISDSAPTGDQWNLGVIEILPAS